MRRCRWVLLNGTHRNLMQLPVTGRFYLFNKCIGSTDGHASVCCFPFNPVHVYLDRRFQAMVFSFSPPAWYVRQKQQRNVAHFLGPFNHDFLVYVALSWNARRIYNHTLCLCAFCLFVLRHDSILFSKKQPLRRMILFIPFFLSHFGTSIKKPQKHIRFFTGCYHRLSFLDVHAQRFFT